jgi:uncharacterized protein YceK
MLHKSDLQGNEYKHQKLGSEHSMYPGKFLRMVIVVFLVQVTVGCASMFSLHHNVKHWSKPGEKKIIYSGVRARNPVMPGGFYHGASPVTVVLYLYFATIDVLLSLGMDTVLLPGTIPMAIMDANRSGQYQCNCYNEWRKASDCFSYSRCGEPDAILPDNGAFCNDLGFPTNQCVLRYR